MTYNIHPIIVHFPIALLFLYSVIRILPLYRWLPAVAWKQTERILLICGVLGAFAASATGEVAEHLVQPDHKLVEMHAFFAGASTWIYGLLLLGELLTVSIPFLSSKITFPRIIEYARIIEKFLTQNSLSKFLAFLGLIAITLTGMLGGVMVYGLSADPAAKIVLKILGITL